MAGKEDRKFRNILILSVGCMLLNGAYFTTAEISQIVLESARVDDPTVVVDGYISLAINYGMFALTNLITSSIVAIVGVRATLVLGSIAYTLYSASFVYPSVFLVYGSSALMGFVGACFYVAHGCYLTNCCTEENIGKYLGIYWSIMSLGQLSGNSFVFWRFRGSNHIDHETRILVVSVLTVISFLSTVTLLFLGPMEPKSKSRQAGPIQNFMDDKDPIKGSFKSDSECESNVSHTKLGILCHSFLEPFRCLGNKHILLLIPPSILNGLDLAYFESILPTVVGFTESFGGDVRKWVGIAGILIGLGSLAGGLIFGTFGDQLVKSNRSIIIGVASTALFLVIILLYLNHPNMSPLEPTRDHSWINPPLVCISLLCAFLLGLGDGCYNTQINAAIGVIWRDNPTAALAIFRFFQGASCAFGLTLGTMTGLVNQLIVFFITCVIGTASYMANEVLIKQKAKSQYDIQSTKLTSVSSHNDVQCITCSGISIIPLKGDF